MRIYGAEFEFTPRTNRGIGWRPIWRPSKSKRHGGKTLFFFFWRRESRPRRDCAGDPRKSSPTRRQSDGEETRQALASRQLAFLLAILRFPRVYYSAFDRPFRETPPLDQWRPMAERAPYVPCPDDNLLSGDVEQQLRVRCHTFLLEQAGLRQIWNTFSR